MQNQVRRIYIYLFCAVTALFWFAMYTYVPILAPYVEHLGGSLSMAGLVVGAYGVTQMVIRIPLGFASDHIGRRKPFVIMGLALTVVSSLGLGFAAGPVAALIHRGLAGFAAGAWVAFTVLFTSYFPRSETAKAMGLIMFSTTMGQTIATTLGGVLMDFYGWGAPFYVGAAAGLVGLALSFAVVEGKSLESRSMDLRDLKRIGTEKLLLRVSTIAILLQALAFASVYGFTPTYAVSLGAGGTELSILALVSALPTALVSLGLGHLSDRFGERRLLTGALILFAVAVMAVPLCTNLGLLYITQALGALGRGAAFPILMGLSIKEVADIYRATAMGFFQSIYALGMTAGPALMGFLGDTAGLRLGFVILGAVGLAAVALVYLWIPQPEPAVHTPENKFQI